MLSASPIRPGSLPILSFPNPAQLLDIVPSLDDPLISGRYPELASPGQPDDAEPRQIVTLFSEWDRLGHSEWSQASLRHIAHRLNLSADHRAAAGKFLKAVLSDHTPLWLPSLWGDEKYTSFIPLLRCQERACWLYGGAGQERIIRTASAENALRIAYGLYEAERAGEIYARIQPGEAFWAGDPLLRRLAVLLLRQAISSGGVVQDQDGRELLQVTKSGRRCRARVSGQQFTYQVGGMFSLWLALLGAALTERGGVLDGRPLLEQINQSLHAPIFTQGDDQSAWAVPGADLQVSGRIAGHGEVRLESQIKSEGLWRLCVLRQIAANRTERIDATAVLSPDRVHFQDAYIVCGRAGKDERAVWSFPQGEAARLLLFVLHPPQSADG